MSDHEVKVTRSGRGSSEGTATFQGQNYEWMAYRETDQKFRVMLSLNGVWIPREKGHPLRAIILPIARAAIQ